MAFILSRNKIKQSNWQEITSLLFFLSWKEKNRPYSFPRIYTIRLFPWLFMMTVQLFYFYLCFVHKFYFVASWNRKVRETWFANILREANFVFVNVNNNYLVFRLWVWRTPCLRKKSMKGGKRNLFSTKEQMYKHLGGYYGLH